MSEVITGGLVSFEDGVKAAEEYAPARKARVELRFDVPENGDAEKALDRVEKLTRAKVAEMIGKRPAAAAAAPSDKEKLAEAAGVGATQQEAAKPSGRKKAPETPKEDPKPAAANDSMEDFNSPPAETAKPISDAELNEATQKKNNKLKDPVKIRQLIGQHATSEPAILANIPQAGRAAYLKALEAL